MVLACEEGDLAFVKAFVEGMTWRRRAFRWMKWSVRKGRIVWLVMHTFTIGSKV